MQPSNSVNAVGALSRAHDLCAATAAESILCVGCAPATANFIASFYPTKIAYSHMLALVHRVCLAYHYVDEAVNRQRKVPVRSKST